MAGVSIDTGDLERTARDLSQVAEKITGEHRKVVSKGALNIKNQLQEEMRGSAHFRGIARAISYDMEGNRFYSEAKIGPTSDPGSAGNLANIAYFGSSRGGGTVPDPRGAMEAEAPKFYEAIENLTTGIL